MPRFNGACASASRKSLSGKCGRAALPGLSSTAQTIAVCICVDTKQVGDRDHLKVFANEDVAETWFQENDPEGVAFEYEVLD
jgi:hypothetical protein